jgi:phosphate transport system permease protein
MRTLVATRRWHSPAGTGDRVFRVLLGVAAAAVPALLLCMGIFLGVGAWPAIRRFGLGFLTTITWDPVAREFGALPMLYGTLVTSALALLLAVPVGLGAAVFLSDLAPRRVRPPFRFLAELLAAVPSVVYGLWGIFVLVPWVRSALGPSLVRSLGPPLFAGPPLGVGFLTAGLILAVMVVPFVVAVGTEVLQAVPLSQREAALALGATRWETIRLAVLPSARSGLAGAVFLALGRALGETMAVTMVIGNRPEIRASLLAPGYTLAALLANEFAEATSDLYVAALIAAGLLLLSTTVLANVLARLLVARTRGGLEALRV